MTVSLNGSMTITAVPSNDHWNGECFVFDRRVGVLGDLSVTDSEVCWACREPLTPEQAQSPDFVRGVSCPYCIE